jgi:enoyl-CoA hydratase
MGRALATAQVIVSMGQVAVRAALKAVHAAGLPLPEGLGIEAEQFGRCCASDDFHEGTRAFLEKRKPAFRNR